MRKKTVRDGIRLLIAALLLLIMGTFYSQEIGDVFFSSSGGAMEFVQLAFFWGMVLGGMAILLICAGFVRSAVPFEKARLLPSFMLLILLLGLFFTMFFRTLSLPQKAPPLRPGETLII